MPVAYTHPLTDIEKKRISLRAAVHRITRRVFERPILRAGKGGHHRGVLAPLPLSAYRRLEPIGFGEQDDDDWWLFPPEDCTPDVVWPLDVGVALDRPNGEGIVLNMFRTVSPKDVRGAATRFGPFMLRHDISQEVGGKLLQATGISVWSGGEWTDANGRKRWDTPDERKSIVSGGSEYTSSDRNQPRMATAFALRQRYEWAVSLGLDNAPTYRFATDPTGIKEVFKLRDAPPGRDRRDALMTWVVDHWRQHRKDPDVEVYVRSHLRGAAKFQFGELTGEVIPSAFDLDVRDRMIAERKSMRVAGTDRRSIPRESAG